MKTAVRKSARLLRDGGNPALILRGSFIELYPTDDSEKLGALNDFYKNVEQEYSRLAKTLAARLTAGGFTRGKIAELSVVVRVSCTDGKKVKRGCENSKTVTLQREEILTIEGREAYRRTLHDVYLISLGVFIK